MTATCIEGPRDTLERCIRETEVAEYEDESAKQFVIELLRDTLTTHLYYRGFGK